MDLKSRKCVLLGYGTETKGYRLYDPKRERVFYSRDVVFNESDVGIEKEPSEQKEKPCMELDDLSGEEIASEPEAVSESEPEEPVLRRSARERRAPNHYGEWASVASGMHKEPGTVAEAIASSEKAKWMNAMDKEMESLRKNDVWELVELPKDRKAIGSKWVFKLKTDSDGSVERHKARLVAQGFSQKHGQDYDETFSPVIRFESLRTVIALAVQNDLQLHQMDVTTAFLIGELEEEVYVRQPEGFVSEGQEHLVCKLKRSIYGLKQSPRCWNSALDCQLKAMSFAQTTSDPCLYISTEGEMFVIAVYVDDIVLAGKSDRRLSEVKKALASKFDVKDLGKLHYFLGVKVVQDQGSKKVWIGQPAYVESILQKFGMENAKPVNTPVDTGSKLVKSTDESEGVDQTLYQSAVGNLLYLSIGTRPDITYAVSSVAKFCADPSKQHLTAVKRILRYLKGTTHLGLLYSKDDCKDCVGYSDADWAGDIDDRKSTSGYLFQIGGTAVSWRSKKQVCVALSTAEAEYMALASAAQEAVWMRQLTSDLKNGPIGPTVIFEDNQSTICMAQNPQFHGRAKHIGIKYHFIREQVSNGTVELKYCRSEMMVADMLTKGLCQDQLIKLRQMAGVKEMPKHFAFK